MYKGGSGTLEDKERGQAGGTKKVASNVFSFLTDGVMDHCEERFQHEGWRCRR